MGNLFDDGLQGEPSEINFFSAYEVLATDTATAQAEALASICRAPELLASSTTNWQRFRL